MKIAHWYIIVWASLMAQIVKNPPAIGRPGFDPWFGKISLKTGMATHSSILAWRIPWTETGRLQSMGSQRVRHDWATYTSRNSLERLDCLGFIQNTT